MKQLLCICLLSLGFTAYSQQTPKEIHDILKNLKEEVEPREDNFYDTAYVCIMKQIKTQTGVNQAIWHSCMANLLTSFYRENQYIIIKRTKVEGEKNKDFNTWDVQTLIAEIVYHYSKSVENKELLQRQSIDAYTILLTDADKSVEYRPTIYDMLVHRALEFLSEELYTMPVPMHTFNLNNAAFLSENAAFVELTITSPDSLSFPFYTLRLMQELTRFHLQSENTLALIDISLCRLEYVYDNISLDNRETLYLLSLENLEKNYRNKAGYEDICYSLGEYYKTQAGKYDPENAPEFRYDYQKAISWYEKAIAAAPESIAANNARVHINDIRRKSISIQIDNVLIPNQENYYRYEHKNTSRIYCRIIPISFAQYQQFGWKESEIYKKLISMKYIKEWNQELKDDGDYQTMFTENSLPALPVGSYVFLVSLTDFDTTNALGYSNQFIDVTNINVLSHRKPIDDTYQTEFVVINRKTGAPFKNMEVTSYYENYNNKTKYNKQTQKTDENGMVSILESSYPQLVIEINNEEGSFKHSTYNYYYRNKTDIEPYTNVYLFTDRAIYRPGQTVYFKGIVIESGYKTNRIVTDKEIEINFHDANGQKIQTLSLKTNEYGSFASSFEIPTDGLSGNFTIRCLNKNHRIAVEEYKRPQFEVVIDAPKGSYKLNEKLNITGKATAYSGYPIDGATVNYRVVREAQFSYWYWWRTRPSSPSREIVQGNSITDAEGKFSFDFIAEEDKSINRYNPIYSYTLYVDVIDINGETHSATSFVSVAAKSMLIYLDFPQAVPMDKPVPALEIQTTNLNGVPQATMFECKIYALEMPKRFLHDKPGLYNGIGLIESPHLKNRFPYLALSDENDIMKWKETEEKYSATHETNGKYALEIPNIKTFKEGYYKIIVRAKDSYNQEVKTERYFFVYSEKGKKCVAYKALWLHSAQTTAAVGDKITVFIGSYLPSTNIYLQVISNDTILDAKWLHLEQGQTSYTLSIDEAHRGTLTFLAYLCDQNNLYREQCTINVPFTNKMIDFEFITFRDKLQPGAKEEWKIKIKGKEGEKLSGELLCSMYDASLDAFRANKYSFLLDYLNLRYVNDLYFSPLKNSYFSRGYFHSFKELGYQFVYRNYYRFLYNFEPSYLGRGDGEIYELSKWEMSDAAVEYEMDQTVSVAAAGKNAKEASSENADYPAVAKNMDEPKPSTLLPRTNFKETAFFYPQLQTDAEGNVVFSFTMPESLTKWKFQGIAHTKDLRTGSFEKFLQTQKELMIVPNAPRFFREGDMLYFSAKVVNMSDTLLIGTVSLELFNAQTNEKLTILVDEKPQNFIAKKGESQEVTFKINIPFQVSAITYRIMASASIDEALFSDGEEKIIPVLSNRMLVTETLPLAINGEQSKTFTFKQMEQFSNTRTPFKYTLEFSSNPAWYAIQALPYMMEYPYQCVEQTFSRMYANSIATHIANSSPKIKEVFDSWKNLSPDAFCSNLEKNQELKSLVLEETPWVMDAQNESANKQRVGLLFDIQRMARENDAAVSRLEKSQNMDGSWSWFEGGRPSRYITQHLVSGFGHLQQLGVKTSLKENCLRKAIQYLDAEIYKDYIELKRTMQINNTYIGYTNLHYLYARSFHLKQHPIAPQHKEAYTFFLNQIKQSWKEASIYLQALTALTLYRNGETELAATIMENIKKRAQYSEELGMYWKKEGYGYYWHEAPIERQALLIEAFNEITKDEVSVEKMKIWLLKQKQTQNWGTTRATTEACYALLINNQQLLSTDENPVIITLGKDTIDVSKVPDNEAGTGYFKTSWLGDEITNDMATIGVKKPSKGIAWGGVYWQYFEDLDKITQDKDIPHPLSLRKALYKVSLNERGEVLTAITEENPLKVGDKVRIRIEIRVDRDMEYVHLKDMRASAFEPTTVFSQYKYRDGLYYYESTRDAATNFFFDYLPKGTYVFEYTVIATQAGVFSNGISSIQCMYAPEFSEHSEGIKVKVE